MDRQTAIVEITDKLKHLDLEALEGLRTLVARLEPSVSASGLPYTGDPETDAELDDPEVVRRIAKDRRSEASFRPLRDIMAELGDHA